MTATYGVTSAGFVSKPYEVIKAELEDDFRSTFGIGVDLSPASPFGQQIGIFAERLAIQWQLAEAVYNAGTPDGAEGVGLVHVCAITGTLQKAPTLSKVSVICTGTAATVLPSGRVVSVQGVGSRFTSAASATLAAVASRAGLTIYTAGDLASADGKVYRAFAGGTTGGGAGPAGTSDGQVDGTVVWDYMGSGTAAAAVEFVAEQSGPISANAKALTVIETPVAGWSHARNPNDQHYLGTALETDPALRLRREQELRAQGNAATEAIRQRVLSVPDVFECFVWSNDFDAVDADGRPAHSVEVLVDGGDDAALAAAIFASKAGGIQAWGLDATEIVTDAEGVDHTIQFSRPTVVDVYVTLEVEIASDDFPDDGEDQLRAAVVGYGAAHYRTGHDVRAAPLASQAFTVSGVLDCVARIGLAPAPGSSATLVTSVRQLPRLDTSRVVVAFTEGSP